MSHHGNLTSALKPQVVRFGPPASHAVGVSFTVSASVSSGPPVSFSSDTPHVCAMSGSTVRTQAAGRCEIRASQGRNTHFQPAADVIQGFTVSAASRFTPNHRRAERSTGPRTLAAVLLAVGILALLAAELKVIRHRLHARPPPTQAARIWAEPQQGPPAAVHIRVTGTRATHAVRIEPHPGTGSAMIKVVQS